MGDLAIDIGKLSQEERLELIEELWESLSEDQGDSVGLTEAQKVELDRRLDLLEKEGPVGISSKELHERIKRRTA